MQISTILAAAPLISCLLTVFLGGFIFLQDFKKRLNLLFALLCLSLGIYNFGVAVVYFSENYETAFFYSRLALGGVIMTICLFPHFTHKFLELKLSLRNLLFTAFFYACSAALIIMNFNSLIFSEIRFTTIGYVIKPLPAYYFFTVVLAASVIYSACLLIKTYLAPGIDYDFKLRIRHFLAGILFCSLFGFFDLMKKIAGIDINFSTFEYGIIIFSGLIAYSIVKHKFLNIELALSRGLLYSLLMLGVTSVFLVTSVTIEQCTQNYIGSNSFFINLINALIIAVIFEPLKNFIQMNLNKYLFPKIMHFQDGDIDDVLFKNQAVIDCLAHKKIDELKSLKQKIEQIINKCEGN
ncbi:MAG: histidine kinase N-terminal 7TM domain-containing protein [Candidatus Wallbacteria bacterium]